MLLFVCYEKAYVSSVSIRFMTYRSVVISKHYIGNQTWIKTASFCHRFSIEQHLYADTKWCNISERIKTYLYNLKVAKFPGNLVVDFVFLLPKQAKIAMTFDRRCMCVQQMRVRRIMVQPTEYCCSQIKFIFLSQNQRETGSLKITDNFIKECRYLNYLFFKSVNFS